MNYQQLQETFQLCSYLLSYPDQEYIDSVEEMESELESMTIPHIKEEIGYFFQKAKNMAQAELVSIYVNTFDFGKKSNLYVTYMSNGEQRERGMDLLFLKNYYKLHGFSVTDKELPDYLPIMLEFASLVDEEIMKPVFERYLVNMKEIAGNVNPNDNLYGHLLRAIMLALQEAGITKSVRRSEELCLNNFYG
ncbi:nitrate reductase molybdenum cofactor assembly chaperone [Bacillus sp. Bva_UNVM-123]|uniref:nitrate reductase molybdenum cofactor assembly chaperone n=1 Tax=Bacillus sp. Bva_UNVM-123 TaxID=2829798 RepID=UPI00391F0F4C